MIKYLWPISLTGILACTAIRFVMINLNPLEIQAQILFSLITFICITTIVASVFFSVKWKIDKLGNTRYERRITGTLKGCLSQGSILATGIVGTLLLRINGVLTPVTFILLCLNLGALLLIARSRRINTK